MARRLTVMVDLVIKDDAAPGEVSELLGAITAQVEDSEVIESFDVRAPGVSGWDDGADR